MAGKNNPFHKPPRTPPVLGLRLYSAAFFWTARVSKAAEYSRSPWRCRDGRHPRPVHGPNGRKKYVEAFHKPPNKLKVRKRYDFQSGRFTATVCCGFFIVNISSAVFECSAPGLDSCPDELLPEFAFIGRSNVGKSSLLNMFSGEQGLAWVSP